MDKEEGWRCQKKGKGKCPRVQINQKIQNRRPQKKQTEKGYHSKKTEWNVTSQVRAHQ